MRKTLIFVLAVLISNRVLPLVWQRDEFVKISWVGGAEWLVAPSTYTAVLFVLVIALVFNYRTILTLNTYAIFCSGLSLGAATAILFIPYDGLNQWHVTLFGYEVGFLLELGLLAVTIFLPVFLRRARMIWER